MIVIDCRGMRCPWPAVRLTRALRGGDRSIEMLADDPNAAAELATVAQAAGLAIEQPEAGRFMIFTAG